MWHATGSGKLYNTKQEDFCKQLGHGVGMHLQMAVCYTQMAVTDEWHNGSGLAIVQANLCICTDEGISMETGPIKHHLQAASNWQQQQPQTRKGSWCCQLHATSHVQLPQLTTRAQQSSLFTKVRPASLMLHGSKPSPQLIGQLSVTQRPSTSAATTTPCQRADALVSGCLVAEAQAPSSAVQAAAATAAAHC